MSEGELHEKLIAMAERLRPQLADEASAISIIKDLINSPGVITVGIYPDADSPSGYGELYIKGGEIISNQLWAASAAGANNMVSLNRFSAIPCSDENYAKWLQMTFGDGATYPLEVLTDPLKRSAASVLKVGGGRGFVVEGKQNRLVITAAHCLPSLPPAMPAAYTEEKTFPRLLGPLGGGPSVAAECLFVDPVADIAILGQADYEFEEENCGAYQNLVEACEPIMVDVCRHEDRLFLLSLDNDWHECMARHSGGGVWFSEAGNGICAGMSGSPAINTDGKAVALVSVAEGMKGTRGGPNPNLAAHLPGWALTELMNAKD
ncbi:hypothetical protein BJ122_10599 [Rhodopseudomonas faecalis]|uniref:Trypsin-like peptidase n=1 Tax=Rhodopseudomonas faecalis TaxID=99655 RepID=A0A318TG14_9BRAD|nr:serine protease [Rhodopseudomonas faecalis]PYF03842.1 hypothetical protein BJ122_10599 [Rhodopseudomonas faecalis]